MKRWMGLFRYAPFVLAGVVAAAVAWRYAHRLFDFVEEGVFGVQIEQSHGAKVSESRTLPPFHAIRLNSRADFEVTVGAPQTVAVETDASALPLLTTTVEDGTLIVDSEAGLDKHGHQHLTILSSGPQVTITVPALDSVFVEGAGKFRLHGLRADRFDLRVDGATVLRADGAVDALSLRIDGAAKLDTTTLEARSVELRIDGVGLARVRAHESLKATVDGIGRVVYYGKPERVEKQSDGLGSIREGGD